MGVPKPTEATKTDEGSVPTSTNSSPNKESKNKKTSLGGLVKSVRSTVRRNKSGKTKKKSSTDSDTVSASSNPAASVKSVDETTTADEAAKSKFLVGDSFSNAVEETTSVGLDLVVLLMDPLSHRFELLQLEFDEANKAKVSDLLAQIPHSVTEACLKNQLYDSILDQDSCDLGKPKVPKSARLVEAFQGCQPQQAGASRKMVVVARPQGISDGDALRMAKPIFANKDIANMLELSGFDVSVWKKKKFTTKPSLLFSNEEEKEEIEEPIQNSSSSYMMLGLVFAFIVGSLLQSVMIKPISADFVMKPGRTLSKCGLYGFIPMKAAVRDALETLPYYDDLAPELLTCEDEFLRVNHDGTATMYDSNRQAFMILKGGVCDSDGCVSGLVLDSSDRILRLGGKPVKQAVVRKSHRDQKLSPWPFEQEPAKMGYKTGSAKAFGASK